MPQKAGYQMAKMGGPQRTARDAIVQQLLDAVTAMHEQRLIRFSDIMLSQCELAPHGEETNRIRDVGFYRDHPDNDYRLELTLVIRAVDR